MPQLSCPTCSASYDVPITALAGSGRKLRCASCKTLFLALDPDTREADAALVDAARQQAQDILAQEAAAQEIAVQDTMTQRRGGHAPDAVLLPRRRKPWHQRIGALPRPQGAGSAPLIALVVLVAIIAALTGFRRQIVAAVPETAVLYAAARLPVNLRGLELSNIKSGIFSENALDLLVVQGEIVNVTKTRRIVPPLAFIVRDKSGQALYAWTASADVSSLEPGARATFRRRLASPPVEGAEVLVRFAGKPDAVAAIDPGLVGPQSRR